MKVLKFLTSKLFLFNILAIIIVWGLIVLIESIYLKKSTNFGEKIAVPTFYKIHMDDLEEFVQGKNISYKIQDSVYLDNWPKGTVCWQYPKPTDSSGMSVKSGREIQLSIVPLHPQMIVIPKVKDLSKRMAETTLNSKGIRTKVSYKPGADGPGYVLEQLYNGKPIKPGTSIPKGSRVEIVVSQGNTGAATALPNLVGLTINEAKERLSTLTLGLYFECPNCLTGSDSLNALIINQSPNGGEGVSVTAGSTVTVWAEKQ
jgi:beta-lactam-binding protein with PASTA domain